MGTQRTQDVPWQTYVQVDDVVLKPFDSKVTTIDLDSTAPIQIASANPVTDADGTRQATLMFRSGTDATMHLPDGTAQQLGDLHVRATEYTVGANGDEAMPGELPPSSAYTYAVELSVDEAVQAKATDVTFSKPVVTYVDDFLHFPAGTIVPAAYYDETKQAWIPRDERRRAQDRRRTGRRRPGRRHRRRRARHRRVRSPSGESRSDELIQLGARYSVGQSLWRVAVQHFTPWDYNWPYGCRAGDCDPPRETPPAPPYCPECQAAGLDRRSLQPDPRRVGSRGRHAVRARLRERPVTGLQGGLHPPRPAYRRDDPVEPPARRPRHHDRRAPHLPELRSRGEPEVHVHVGRHRRVRARARREGRSRTYVSATSIPPSTYNPTSSSAASPSSAGARSAPTARGARSRCGRSGTGRSASSAPAPTPSAAGRSASITPTTRKRRSSTSATGLVGRRKPCARRSRPSQARAPSSGNGSTALGTGLGYVRGVTAAADGGFYIADADNNVIRRVTPSGGIQRVAGGGSPADGIGDGLQATQAQLLAPSDVAVADDGTLYISDTGNARIRRVTPNGVITTIAGGGDPAALGDGGAATSASLRAGARDRPCARRHRLRRRHGPRSRAPDHSGRPNLHGRGRRDAGRRRRRRRSRGECGARPSVRRGRRRAGRPLRRRRSSSPDSQGWRRRPDLDPRGKRRPRIGR